MYKYANRELYYGKKILDTPFMLIRMKIRYSCLVATGVKNDAEAIPASRANT